MDAYRAVVDKRDQRAFLPKPIPEDALRRILQAGRMTGSSKNSEPNRFIVIRDRARLAAVAALGTAGALGGRAAVVIVIAQTVRHEYDAGRCAQNMMVVGVGRRHRLVPGPRARGRAGCAARRARPRCT